MANGFVPSALSVMASRNSSDQLKAVRLKLSYTKPPLFERMEWRQTVSRGTLVQDRDGGGSKPKLDSQHRFSWGR